MQVSPTQQVQLRVESIDLHSLVNDFSQGNSHLALRQFGVLIESKDFPTKMQLFQNLMQILNQNKCSFSTTTWETIEKFVCDNIIHPAFQNFLSLPAEDAAKNCFVFFTELQKLITISDGDLFNSTSKPDDTSLGTLFISLAKKRSFPKVRRYLLWMAKDPGELGLQLKYLFLSGRLARFFTWGPPSPALDLAAFAFLLLTDETNGLNWTAQLEMEEECFRSKLFANPMDPLKLLDELRKVEKNPAEAKTLEEIFKDYLIFQKEKARQYQNQTHAKVKRLKLMSSKANLILQTLNHPKENPNLFLSTSPEQEHRVLPPVIASIFSPANSPSDSPAFEEIPPLVLADCEAQPILQSQAFKAPEFSLLKLEEIASEIAEADPKREAILAQEAYSHVVDWIKAHPPREEFSKLADCVKKLSLCEVFIKTNYREELLIFLIQNRFAPEAKLFIVENGDVISDHLWNQLTSNRQELQTIFEHFLFLLELFDHPNERLWLEKIVNGEMLQIPFWKKQTLNYEEGKAAIAFFNAWIAATQKLEEVSFPFQFYQVVAQEISLGQGKKSKRKRQTLFSQLSETTKQAFALSYFDFIEKESIDLRLSDLNQQHRLICLFSQGMDETQVVPIFKEFYDFYLNLLEKETSFTTEEFEYFNLIKDRNENTEFIKKLIQADETLRYTCTLTYIHGLIQAPERNDLLYAEAFRLFTTLFDSPFFLLLTPEDPLIPITNTLSKDFYDILSNNLNSRFCGELLAKLSQYIYTLELFEEGFHPEVEVFIKKATPLHLYAALSLCSRFVTLARMINTPEGEEERKQAIPFDSWVDIAHAFKNASRENYSEWSEDLQSVVFILFKHYFFPLSESSEATHAKKLINEISLFYVETCCKGFDRGTFSSALKFIRFDGGISRQIATQQCLHLYKRTPPSESLRGTILGRLMGLSLLSPKANSLIEKELPSNEGKLFNDLRTTFKCIFGKKQNAKNKKNVSKPNLVDALAMTECFAKISAEIAQSARLNSRWSINLEHWRQFSSLPEISHWMDKKEDVFLETFERAHLCLNLAVLKYTWPGSHIVGQIFTFFSSVLNKGWFSTNTLHVQQLHEELLESVIGECADKKFSWAKIEGNLKKLLDHPKILVLYRDDELTFADHMMNKLETIMRFETHGEKLALLFWNLAESKFSLPFKNIILEHWVAKAKDKSTEFLEKLEKIASNFPNALKKLDADKRVSN